jgi:hypothetical protein
VVHSLSLLYSLASSLSIYNTCAVHFVCALWVSPHGSRQIGRCSRGIVRRSGTAVLLVSCAHVPSHAPLNEND